MKKKALPVGGNAPKKLKEIVWTGNTGSNPLAQLGGNKLPLLVLGCFMFRLVCIPLPICFNG
jgi:hypothetical protein